LRNNGSFINKVEISFNKIKYLDSRLKPAGMTDFFAYFVIPVKTGIQKDCYSWFEEFLSTKIRKRGNNSHEPKNCIFRVNLLT